MESSVLIMKSYQVWWDREMASNAVVMPVVFNFQGTACRALKLDPSRGAASAAPCNPVALDWGFPMGRLFLLRNTEGATDAGRRVLLGGRRRRLRAVPGGEQEQAAGSGGGGAAAAQLQGGAGGAASVASFLAAVLAELYLCSLCSCQEILRRSGRG
eukprot:COSAG01_NODE_21883_length_881_cov_0.791560_1_plen_157_part_00